MAMNPPKLPNPVLVVVHVHVQPFAQVHVLHEPPLGSQPSGVFPEHVLLGLLGSSTVGTPEQTDEQVVFTLNRPPPKRLPGLRKITLVCDEVVPMTSPASFMIGCLTTSFASTLSASASSIVSCSAVISRSSSVTEESFDSVLDWHPIASAARIMTTRSFEK
jgi:hypothetical protein